MTYIIKRDGKEETFQSEKLASRLSKLSEAGQLNHIDIEKLSDKISKGLYPGVTTSELDNLAAETCASMVSQHIQYQEMAGRIVISKMHRETKPKFSQVISDIYNDINPNTGLKSTLICDEIYRLIQDNAEILDCAVNDDLDYKLSYFAFRTLERSYLLKIKDKIAEGPQHMFMRVAVGIHRDDLISALETYQLMSEKWFIHATPTLFNAGTKFPQFSSCFLLTMKGDSLDGILETFTDCCKISKHAGGIGLNVHCIRSTGSPIIGTNGTSNGLVPMLQMFNSAARYVNQGGNKRPGAFAIYIEPWHADVFDFLELRKNHGDESKRARELFIGLWVPDLFMKRVQTNDNWTLMDPNKCPGLFECWGDDFVTLYERYENEGRGARTVTARALWRAILDAQIETGTPYMLYKDACNSKSNHQHLGTIKCSNLCTEIVEYSAPDEIAVCNLASIALPRFVDRRNRTFDFKQLIKVTGVITNNLNKIIDGSQYPVPETKKSNMRHRPIGIGVQGLADVFAMMRYSFDSPEAAQLNRRIFETIYYGALKKSCELAREFGPYETYPGSPVSRGILQPDMWDNVTCNDYEGDLDWTLLRSQIAEHGVRNSLLVAPMPTASTSQILGNNECFEAFTTNIYLRRVMSGEFVVVNKYLLEDLIELGVWSNDLKHAIIANRGSIQNIIGLSDELKKLYKTVWEIPQSVIINMAADRAPFIDQSMSMNFHVGSPDYENLTSLHFLAWKKGLKTGMYYLRTRPAADPIQFTVDKSRAANLTINEQVQELATEVQKTMACSLKDREGCGSCQG